MAKALPFRDLHKRYPVENLQEALGEGIATGHSKMPEFKFEPKQVDEIIDYLKTLERHPQARNSLSAGRRAPP